MFRTPALPTIFATNVAESVGLLEQTDSQGYVNQEDNVGFAIKDAQARLHYFQQMAITCTIDDCMLAYHGVNLTEQQEIALQLIYKSTVPWLTGHVIGELIKSETATISHAELILSQLVKDGKMDKDKAKEWLLKFQVVPLDKPFKGREDG